MEIHSNRSSHVISGVGPSEIEILETRNGISMMQIGDKETCESQFTPEELKEFAEFLLTLT